MLKFTAAKEEKIEQVRKDIKELTYEQSEYRYFKVYEPKERQIMALPFYDRVVQHAVVNILEPIFDKRFISHSYACRKGKGMHAHLIHYISGCMTGISTTQSSHYMLLKQTYTSTLRVLTTKY